MGILNERRKAKGERRKADEADSRGLAGSVLGPNQPQRVRVAGASGSAAAGGGRSTDGGSEAAAVPRSVSSASPQWM